MSKHSALASFIPRELRYALAEGRTPDTNTRGAALFGDISGFTPFTLALAEEFGPTRGAEELVHHMATAFDLLVGEVHRYGGSVIGFAGDAVTCWFEAGDGGEAEAALRATAAAVSMRDALTGFEIATPGGSVFTLSIKVAVAAGEAKRFFIGNPELQRLSVIAGATVSRMAATEQLAQGGEALLSEEVVDLLGSGIQITEWKTSRAGHRCAVIDSINQSVDEWQWPPEPLLSAETLQPWVVNDIFDLVSKGREEYMGAFRRVASLFLRFEGIDYDHDQEAESLLDEFVRNVQAVLARYEGQIIDLNIGDKGSYFSLSFGAMREYEDLARRAVTAADALIEVARQQEGIESASLGIAYANAYAGAYGCQRRRTFGTLSKQVILAARLMSKAGKFEVLVSPEIADGASASHRFEPLPPAPLKGFEGDYHAHRLLGLREQLGEIADQAFRIVGRNEEQRIIADAIPRHGQTAHAARLVIEGEAGMGKSTLLFALRRAVSEAGLRLLRGSAEAIHRSTSFHVWRPVFESVIGLDTPGVTAEDRVERCRAHLGALGSEVEKLLPLLNSVLGLSVAENETTRQMEGSVRADNTNDLLLRILQAEEGPVVLILEDFHWFDSSSVSLLELVARSLLTSLIVVTRRPRSDGYEYSEISEDTRVLHLGPLCESDVVDLLKNVLGASVLPTDVIRLISDKAEGSPFFSKELALALRDTGVIEVVGDECRLAEGINDLSALDFPDTIQGVIASRLDLLPTQQQMAVKVASVIGRIFAVRLLNAVHPIEEDRRVLPQSLKNLERAEVAHEEPDASEYSYLFNHVLTQEVAYGRLLHEQRAQLHRRVGEWLEGHPTGDSSSDLPLLAHHFALAVSASHDANNLLDKAMDYLGRAGTQALRAHMNREAVRFYGEAIELARIYDKPEIAHWYAGLAHAHEALGELDAARQYGGIALGLIDMAFPESKARMLGDSLANIVRIVVRMLKRRSLFPVWEATGNSDVMWKPEDPMLLLRVIAKSLFLKNDVLAMLCANIRSLYLSDQMKPGPEVAMSYGHAAMTIDFFGMHQTAASFSDRALQMAKEAQSPATMVSIYIMRGIIHLGNAAWTPACEDFEKAREAAAELGDDWQWGEAQAMLADVALMRGDLDEATHRYAEIEENAVRRGIPAQQVWCMRPPVLRALSEDRMEDALLILEDRQRQLSQVPDALVKIDALGFKALAQVRMGDADAALVTINAAHKIILEVSPPVSYPRYFGYRALGEACMRLYEADPLSSIHRKNAEQAVRYLAEYAKGFDYAAPRALLIRGWYLAIRGRKAAAVRLLEQAVASAGLIGLEPEIVLGQELQARNVAQA